MNIQDFLDKWFDEGTSEYTEAEEELRGILGKTRATVLAEEERRVWCETYADSLAIGFGSKVDPAKERADFALAAYREAQRAWEEQKEKG